MANWNKNGKQNWCDCNNNVANMWKVNIGNTQKPEIHNNVDENKAELAKLEAEKQALEAKIAQLQAKSKEE